MQHQQSDYSAQSQYSAHGGYDGNNDPNVYGVPGQQNVEYVQPGPSLLSDKEFLAQVEAIKKMIRELTTNVDNIASLHQQSLNSTDGRGSGPLEALVTDTQVKNTMIREQIKKLEVDAARSRGNQMKDAQIKQLKTSFTNQLQLYRQEEAKYEQRYREQIARQYRIVNPQASDAEVAEASQADWGNEGIFQTAVSMLLCRSKPSSYMVLTFKSSNRIAQPLLTLCWARSARDTMTFRRSKRP